MVGEGFIRIVIGNVIGIKGFWLLVVVFSLERG